MPNLPRAASLLHRRLEKPAQAVDKLKDDMNARFAASTAELLAVRGEIAAAAGEIAAARGALAGVGSEIAHLRPLARLPDAIDRLAHGLSAAVQKGLGELTEAVKNLHTKGAPPNTKDDICKTFFAETVGPKGHIKETTPLGVMFRSAGHLDLDSIRKLKKVDDLWQVLQTAAAAGDPRLAAHVPSKDECAVLLEALKNVST